MSKIKFNNSFNLFLAHINTANMFEALCLCSYYFTYKEIKDMNEEKLTTTKGILYEINGWDFMRLLGGVNFLSKKLHLEDFLTLSTRFFQLKLALNYPHLKIAECPQPQKTKEDFINILNKIIEKDKDLEINDLQLGIIKKYRDYIFFSMKQMVCYLSKYDMDFLPIGNKNFNNFINSKPKENVNHLIAQSLNRHIDKYYAYINELPANTYQEDILIEDESIKNIYDYIEHQSPLILDLFKQDLNSYKKGKLGEEIFGQLNKGEVIGHKGGKTDVVENGRNISLKTSYSNSWNHHLAYLNKEKHKEIIECLDNKTPFFKLKDINWSEMINYFISHEEKVDELVFQKVKLDELNQKPTKIELWRFNKEDILEMIKNKQFIFQNNNIIIFNQQEQFIKLSFKKRTGSYQVLVITEESSLNTVVENNLGKYEIPMNSSNKIKP